MQTILGVQGWELRGNMKMAKHLSYHRCACVYELFSESP